MTFGTRLIWSAVAILVLASVAFAAGVPARRERGRAAAEAALEQTP